eukprot:8510653-Alexandrium_andersonii.AAC.1
MNLAPARLRRLGARALLEWRPPSPSDHGGSGWLVAAVSSGGLRHRRTSALGHSRARQRQLPTAEH